jgi:thiol-disulfide isomerase/thioredoxin
VQDGTARRGVVKVNGRPIVFELRGWNGHYNDDPNSLYFDLDGDGKLDTETRYSTEQFKVKERYVNIGDKTYEFTVDRFGERLTLRPAANRMPDRADLREGNSAPDFVFADLEGKQHRLSDFRGKVVLIDVWGLWCGPCVAEAPRMSGVYGRLREKGLEIVSLDKGDTVENLKKFIAKNNMNWTHGHTDEAFLTLYRVDGFPTYFLLDRDGRIVSNNLRPGDELYAKIEETLKR